MTLSPWQNPRRLADCVHTAAAALLLNTSLAGFLHAGSSCAIPFVYETADGTGDVGLFASLALDSNGDPCVSYYDATNHTLKFATRIRGTWHSEFVDVGGQVGMWTSLALDSKGNPRIAYSGNNKIKFAAKDTGWWSTDTVDAMCGQLSDGCPLVLDSLGNPHIVYEDNCGNFKFASKADGAWTVELLQDGGQFPSIAVNHRGDFLISYSHGDYLGLASRHDGVWHFEIADPVPSPDYYTSLALDSQDNPAIGFFATSGDLRLASRAGETWATETVASAVNAVNVTSLKMDTQNDPHISFTDGYSGHLVYATKCGGPWSLEIVDSTEATGRYSSLALDGQGYPRISYYAANGRGLRYAYGPAGVGVEDHFGNSALKLFLLSPNPCHTGQALSISFSLPIAESVSLELSDVSGRRIGERRPERFSAGLHQLRWGESVQPGLYFLRLRGSAGEMASDRLVILR